MFVVGDRVRVSSTASPSNFMEGNITALTANTSITVNVDLINGSGSFADWTFGWPNPVTNTSGTVAFPADSSAMAIDTAKPGPSVPLTVPGTYYISARLVIGQTAKSAIKDELAVILKCGTSTIGSAHQTLLGTNVLNSAATIVVDGICVSDGTTSATTDAYSNLANLVIRATTSYPTGSIGTTASAITYLKIK